jgi:hypothetical protein
VPRITLQIQMWNDDQTEYRAVYLNGPTEILTQPQCEQIAREMQEHFNQVVAENPDARAVADAIAHPSPALITIDQDFSACEPDRVYQNILKANGLP